MFNQRVQHNPRAHGVIIGDGGDEDVAGIMVGECVVDEVASIRFGGPKLKIGEVAVVKKARKLV
jgi:hypothetical protein